MALTSWAAPKDICAQEPPAASPQAMPSRAEQLVIGESRRLTFPGLVRFLVGDPTILEVVQAADALTLTGKDVGRTFVHVWAAHGRTTLVVRVEYPPLPEAAHPLTPEEMLVERARPLRIGYDVTYESVRRGENFSEADQSTTNILTHAIAPDMETPYGGLSGFARYTRLDRIEQLTTWTARLLNGHVGSFRDFDAIAGDSSVPFDGFGLNAPPYRGGTLIYRGVRPWHATGLWGRERASAFQFAADEENPDSYVSGGQLAFAEPGSPWTASATMLGGYGEDRLAEASDYVGDVQNRILVLPPLTLETETAVDQDQDFGYTLGSIWQTNRMSSRVTFRDIREEFDTITGPGGEQGELGVRADGSIQMTPTISLFGSGDYYRERLFPNPEDPEAWNSDLAGSVSWKLTQLTNLTGQISQRRSPGQLSPGRDSSWGVSASQRVPVVRLLPLIDAVDLSGGYEFQETKNILAPESDSESHGVFGGITVPLPLGFAVSATHDHRELTEVLSGSESKPKRTTATLSHGSNYFSGRLGIDGLLGYERERESGALSSGLAGQDRVIGEAGVQFSPLESTELFADGRVENVRFEATNTDQMEFSLFTGARVLFDTKLIRWEPATTVRGVVFQDRNRDGIRQPDEPGVKGVKVVTGIARRDTTDAEGRFSFWRVAGKAMPISLDLTSLPQGYIVTTPRVHVIRPATQRRPMLEFGIVGIGGDVRGRVFEDIDGNQRFTEVDRGLEGILLQLDGRVARSDPAGYFFFRELQQGQYTVRLVLESVPINMLPLVPAQQSVTLAEADTATVDFPMAIQRTLQGTVFVDENVNGLLDAFERGIRDIPICLDGRLVSQTDSDGVYRFLNIRLGSHSAALNCGLPMDPLRPLMNPSPTIQVRPQDPETVVYDFPLERKPSSPPEDAEIEGEALLTEEPIEVDGEP
jgi:hypothetical protein